MTQRRLAAVDAQNLWMSAKIPNDQFLLYGFGAAPAGVLDGLRDRARRCAALTVRVRDAGAWHYPVWEDCPVDDEQFVVHDADDWAAVSAAVVRLADHQVDATVHPWRLHLFPAVAAMPGVGAGSVAVLQVSHALADGARSADLAAWLFGRGADAGPPVLSGRARGFVPRSVRAGVAHRRLVADTDAGLVPPQSRSCPVLRSNTAPSGELSVRTVLRHRAQLPGPTVTAGVLAAVSEALAGQLRELGEDPSLLGAEVPMAKAGPRMAHNHFGNVGVGLYPALAPHARAHAIAVDLSRRRRRVAHPAMAAEDAAFAAMPAALLRWGTSAFDPTVRSETVIGNTVVSSVNRGAADLSLGGTPVAFTTGFPALSPMMGVTHGVHGIGDIVAVSVHAAASAIGDVDAYLDRLAHALG